MTDTVAVGTFKAAPDSTQRYWICEIHQLVAGATKELLEKALGKSRHNGVFYGGLLVKEVVDLGPAIERVLRSDLRGWPPIYA